MKQAKVGHDSGLWKLRFIVLNRIIGVGKAFLEVSEFPKLLDHLLPCIFEVIGHFPKGEDCNTPLIKETNVIKLH